MNDRTLIDLINTLLTAFTILLRLFLKIFDSLINKSLNILRKLIRLRISQLNSSENILFILRTNNRMIKFTFEIFINIVKIVIYFIFIF